MTEELRPPSVVAAAWNGDAGEVRRLIETGTDIETRDEDDDTPLLAAAGRGHLEVVRYLRGRGADSRATNKYGRTALIRAAQSGNLAVAETMLRVGAKVNLGDKEHQTPLMMAAAKGGIDMVKFLVARGALIEAQDKEGHNALLYAVNFGQVDTTKYLLDHYADKLLGGRVNLNHLVSAAINAPSLHCTAETAEECAILILEAIGDRAASISVPVVDEQGLSYTVSLLSWVIGTKKYSKNLIKTVLAWGANPNAEYVFGKTKFVSMLFAAFFLGHPDALEALLETGNVNTVEIGATLALAITGKREDEAALLIRYGAVATGLSRVGLRSLVALATGSEIICKVLGISKPAFEMTTNFAKDMNWLSVMEGVKASEEQVREYFAIRLLELRDLPKYLSLLRTLLAKAPFATTKYAAELRKVVVTAHLGSARRIEDERRGLRRAINEMAKIVAHDFDWYEDSEEALGFAEYLLASSDYKDAVRAGREAASRL